MKGIGQPLRSDDAARPASPSTLRAIDPGGNRREASRVPRRLTLVDGLRGIAAVAVLFDHLPGMFGNPLALTPLTQAVLLQWGYFGRLGVDIFFVLSGFVITLSLAKSKIDLSYWLRFAARRSLRLDPPYWVSIVLCIVLIVVRRHLFAAQVDLPTWPQIGAHLVYLQGVLGFQQINSVFWTLCIEFQLYLGFCALMGFLQWRRSPERGPQWCALGTFCAFVLSLWWPAHGLSAETDRTTLLPFMCEFLAGSLAYWVWSKRLPAVAGTGSMVLLVMLGFGTGNPSIVTAGLTALLLAAAGVYGTLARWLSGPVFQALGRISYSLYLLHVPTFTVVLALRTRVRGAESEAGGWLLCIVGVGATLGLSWVFHRLVEKPALSLSHRVALTPSSTRARVPGEALEPGTPLTGGW